MLHCWPVAAFKAAGVAAVRVARALRPSTRAKHTTLVEPRSLRPAKMAAPSMITGGVSAVRPAGGWATLACVRLAVLAPLLGTPLPASCPPPELVAPAPTVVGHMGPLHGLAPGLNPVGLLPFPSSPVELHRDWTGHLLQQEATPVSEPSTLAVLAAGAGAALLSRTKRRRLLACDQSR